MSAYDLNNAPGFKRSENERRAARCVTHHHACDCRKAATDAEIERLAWNLAGCDVIANGGPIECDESMALPALSAVIKLRQERDRLRERVRALESEREAMETRTWGWPKDSPDDTNADPESHADEADYDDGAEFDWVVATELRVERYRVKWERDDEGNWMGNDIELIDDAAKAMDEK